MIEIREIEADELERWIGVAGRVRDDRGGGAGEYVDWKRQAEDMVWLIASKDGEDAGAALAYVGWHSKPGTGHGEVFVLPESTAARASARRSTSAVAEWVQERGCVTLETAVAEDDAESLAWVDRRGFREVGRNSRMVLDLTAIEAPAIDPPEGVEIVTWAERPELALGLYAVACEAYPDVPGDEGHADGLVRGVAPEGHAGRRRPARRDVRRARRRRGGRIRQALALERRTRRSPTTT